MPPLEDCLRHPMKFRGGPYCQSVNISLNGASLPAMAPEPRTRACRRRLRPETVAHNWPAAGRHSQRRGRVRRRPAVRFVGAAVRRSGHDEVPRSVRGASRGSALDRDPGGLASGPRPLRVPHAPGIRRRGGKGDRSAPGGAAFGPGLGADARDLRPRSRGRVRRTGPERGLRSSSDPGRPGALGGTPRRAPVPGNGSRADGGGARGGASPGRPLGFRAAAGPSLFRSRRARGPSGRRRARRQRSDDRGSVAGAR